MCEEINDPYPKVEHINLQCMPFLCKINEGALQDFGLGKCQISVNFKRFRVFYSFFIMVLD